MTTPSMDISIGIGWYGPHFRDIAPAARAEVIAEEGRARHAAGLTPADVPAIGRLSGGLQTGGHR